MTPQIKTILMPVSTGVSEVWLVGMAGDGTWSPLPGTGPINLPAQWQEAIAAYKEKQLDSTS